MASARTLLTRLNITLRTEHRDNTEDYGGLVTTENIPLDDFTQRVNQSLTFGDGDGEANIVWHDRRRLWGAEEHDMTGVLIDKFGGVLTFTAVKALFFYNHELVNPLNVLGAAALNDEFDSFRTAATATEPVILQPGASWSLWAPYAGYAVAPGADIIRVDAGAVGVYYDIVIVGVGTRVEDEPTTVTTTTSTETTSTATTTTTATTA